MNYKELSKLTDSIKEDNLLDLGGYTEEELSEVKAIGTPYKNALEMLKDSPNLTAYGALRHCPLEEVRKLPVPEKVQNLQEQFDIEKYRPSLAKFKEFVGPLAVYEWDIDLIGEENMKKFDSEGYLIYPISE